MGTFSNTWLLCSCRSGNEGVVVSFCDHQQLFVAFVKVQILYPFSVRVPISWLFNPWLWFVCYDMIHWYKPLLWSLWYDSLLSILLITWLLSPGWDSVWLWYDSFVMDMLCLIWFCSYARVFILLMEVPWAC